MSDTLRRSSLFGRAVLQRAKALLWMRYTPEEIAEELHVDDTTIWDDWLSNGAPVDWGDDGQLWIMGTALRDWILAENNRPRVGSRLQTGHAYCTQCQATRPIAEPLRCREVSPSLDLVEGYCAECGAVVFRGVRKSPTPP